MKRRDFCGFLCLVAAAPLAVAKETMIRKRFFVNGVTSAGTVDHAKYLRPAQTLLENVKRQTGYGGIQQLSQRYENEDGVKLTASSRFGLDEIVIDIPAGVPRPAGRKPVELEGKFFDIVVVGQHDHYIDNGGSPLLIATPFIWKKATGLVDIELLGGDISGAAYAVSADGATVVGYSHHPTADFTDVHSWMWRKGLGPVALASSDLDSTATDVSEFGNIVVGINFTHNYDLWRWTSATGTVLLPEGSEIEVIGGGGGTGIKEPKISPNGQYICGGVSLTYAVGRIWMPDGSVVTTPTYTYPIDIADDGTALLQVSHLSGSPGNVLWNVRTGKYTPIPEWATNFTFANALSRDGKTAVGLNASGWSAALWTKKDGEVVLVPTFGSDDAGASRIYGEAFGVSEDGKLIVGFVGSVDLDDFVPFLVDSKGKRTAITLPTSASAGFAWDIATPKTKMTIPVDPGEEASAATEGFFTPKPAHYQR